ncbi:MAG: glycosyltransferase [Nitrospira sp.]|nr:glycosyltransferase [Nitrospira sp.]
MEGEEKMTVPTVSVVIPIYNCVEYLQQALTSALNQQGVGIEILLVDSSTDDSCAAIARKSDARVRYTYQESRGVSAARNLGIRQARGEFIAFLDADDEWLPDKLSMQVSALRKFPQAGLVFTDTMMFRDSTVIQAAMNRDMLKEWRRSHVSDLPGWYCGNLYSQLLTQDCMNTSSVLVRRKAVEEQGLFDENFKVGEDYDLWLRIARSCPMIFIDRVLCRYRVHNDGLSGGEDVRALRWLEAHIAVREKHRRMELVPAQHMELLRDILGRHAWEAGWNHFGHNQFHEARRHFSAAIRAKPFVPRTWLYWCCSFLPTRVVEAIRTIRRPRKAGPRNGTQAQY